MDENNLLVRVEHLERHLTDDLPVGGCKDCRYHYMYGRWPWEETS